MGNQQSEREKKCGGCGSANPASANCCMNCGATVETPPYRIVEANEFILLDSKGAKAARLGNCEIAGLEGGVKFDMFDQDGQEVFSIYVGARSLGFRTEINAGSPSSTIRLTEGNEERCVIGAEGSISLRGDKGITVWPGKTEEGISYITPGHFRRLRGNTDEEL